ncbi:MAG: YbaN family protein [Bacillota bacterium]
MKKYILIIFGSIALGLGVAGIFLPVLPTTPFLLMTLICYTKGSKRFETWFKKTCVYQKHLKPFLLTKTLTNFNKFKILFFVTVVIAIPIILINLFWVRIFLLIVILTHYIYFIFKVKSVSREQQLLLIKEAENS